MVFTFISLILYLNTFIDVIALKRTKKKTSSQCDQMLTGTNLKPLYPKITFIRYQIPAQTKKYFVPYTVILNSPNGLSLHQYKDSVI